MSIETPTVPPEPTSEDAEALQRSLEAEKAAYAAKERLVADAKGFESLATAVTEIGPFTSSDIRRKPYEIIAKLKALERAADEIEVKDILQTIPRMYGIRDKVMDIMGIEK